MLKIAKNKPCNLVCLNEVVHTIVMFRGVGLCKKHTNTPCLLLLEMW